MFFDFYLGCHWFSTVETALFTFCHACCAIRIAICNTKFRRSFINNKIRTVVLFFLPITLVCAVNVKIVFVIPMKTDSHFNDSVICILGCILSFLRVFYRLNGNALNCPHRRKRILCRLLFPFSLQVKPKFFDAIYIYISFSYCYKDCPVPVIIRSIILCSFCFIFHGYFRFRHVNFQMLKGLIFIPRVVHGCYTHPYVIRVPFFTNGDISLKHFILKFFQRIFLSFLCIVQRNSFCFFQIFSAYSHLIVNFPQT